MPDQRRRDAGDRPVASGDDDVASRVRGRARQRSGVVVLGQLVQRDLEPALLERVRQRLGLEPLAVVVRGRARSRACRRRPG